MFLRFGKCFVLLPYFTLNYSGSFESNYSYFYSIQLCSSTKKSLVSTLSVGPRPYRLRKMGESEIGFPLIECVESKPTIDS